MERFVAPDGHGRHSQVVAQGGRVLEEGRIEHERGAIREFLSTLEKGAPVAFEAIGSWHWIAEEIEQAGCRPRLAHARKAELMMGMANKSDELDAHGLDTLRRNGTLPEVWMPPVELGDVRELTRTRGCFVALRTGLKNRFHSALAKHGPRVEASDIFAPGAREELRRAMELPPENARIAAGEELDYVDHLEEEVAHFDARIGAVFESTPEVELLDTLPGAGFVLAVAIWPEVGDVGRFASHEKLATYAGTTPRRDQSGARDRFGRVRSDVNRFPKRAYVEAANVVCMDRDRRPERHVARLYERVSPKSGRGRAVVAVARRLAEATYWMLEKHEAYREPRRRSVPSTGARAR